MVIDDKVVLQCEDVDILLSKYIYLSSSGFGLGNSNSTELAQEDLYNFEFYPDSGSWQVIFYEADGIF